MNLDRRCLLALLFLPRLAFAEEPSAELLARLADWTERTEPQRVSESMKMSTRSEELDGGGTVQHVDEVVTRLTRGPDGRPVPEVLRATRDGRDNIAEVRKRQAGRQAKPDPNRKNSVSAVMPFARDAQAKYRFWLLPPYRDDPGRLRIGFGPRGEPEAGIYLGEAKVDPAQGSVLWLKQRPSKLPPFVDEIEMELEFNTSSPYGSMLSSMKFYGSGGVPLFKKRGRASIRMSDYVFAPPVKGAAP